MNARRNFARCAAAAAVMVSMLAVLSDAQAYRMIQNTSTERVTRGDPVACNAAGGFAHWNSHSIHWFYNPAGQGSDKIGALWAAAASWNDVQDAHYDLQIGSTAADFATDGRNTISWGTGNGCTETCIALTALVLQAGQVIVESDITFRADVNWTANGGNYDTQAVATHEFGHSLGIHHTEVTSGARPTMWELYFGSDERSLELDDRSALQCAQRRYPPPGTATPGAPTSLRVASRLCDASYSVTWNISPDPANWYELYVSANPGFYPQQLAWSGSWLIRTRTVRVDQVFGQRWYRIRACNNNICSPYSNSLKLDWFSGC